MPKLKCIINSNRNKYIYAAWLMCYLNVSLANTVRKMHPTSKYIIRKQNNFSLPRSPLTIRCLLRYLNRYLTLSRVQITVVLLVVLRLWHRFYTSICRIHNILNKQFRTFCICIFLYCNLKDNHIYPNE